MSGVEVDVEHLELAASQGRGSGVEVDVEHLELAASQGRGSGMEVDVELLERGASLDVLEDPSRRIPSILRHCSIASSPQCRRSAVRARARSCAVLRGPARPCAQACAGPAAMPVAVPRNRQGTNE
eukprot:gene31434-6612_t